MPYDLWSIAKKFSSGEISKISIPINFCEPLSMLQRMVEDFEYAFVLDNAATLNDPAEQMSHVTAFTVSPYCHPSSRVGKPLNPLLGETFEFDRTDDLGWRSISEQVSHHPPVSALYVEGKKWKCWQHYGVSMKFRGNFVVAKPEGRSHLVFDSGNHYSWTKVLTRVNSIIIGTLWVDQAGTSEVISHTHDLRCELSYKPSSSKKSKKIVSGTVVTSTGENKWTVQGAWDDSISVSLVYNKEAENTGKTPNVVVWQKNDKRDRSPDYYFFSDLAMQLNDTEDGVAPTDSRNRIDIRTFENGDWKLANDLKTELEEKQRTRMQSTSKAHEPIWFQQETDPVTGEDMYTYKGKYWKCKKNKDWGMCPNIF